MSSFESLPSESRLWIFALAERLSPEASRRLTERMESFTASWKAHGDDVAGSFSILRERFLAVAATEEQVLVSGCSIDSLFRFVTDTLSEIGVEPADFSDVFFLKGQEVKRVSREEFKALARNGEVSAETIVFDTSIQKLGALRDGKFELPAGESWHQRWLTASDQAAV